MSIRFVSTAVSFLSEKNSLANNHLTVLPAEAIRPIITEAMVENLVILYIPNDRR
jgi:hypothetical protein